MFPSVSHSLLAQAEGIHWAVILILIESPAGQKHGMQQWVRLPISCTPQGPQPPKPSSWGHTQPTFGWAASTTELGVQTNGHHHQGWTLVYQKLVATSMCSTKTTHGNIHSRCSHIWCAAQTYPSQMQLAELLLAPTKESYVKKVSGTWHCDTLLSLLSVLSEHRGASGTAGDPTAANAAPPWKPHRLADRRISHSREEKEKQAVKEGGEKKSAAKGKIPYRFTVNYLPEH